MKALEGGFQECFPCTDTKFTYDALVIVIKQCFNLKIVKSKKVSQDYLLKLVQEKISSRDLNAGNLQNNIAAGTKRVNTFALK